MRVGSKSGARPSLANFSFKFNLLNENHAPGAQNACKASCHRRKPA
jgi:hypothetical protein